MMRRRPPPSAAASPDGSRPSRPRPDLQHPSPGESKETGAALPFAALGTLLLVVLALVFVGLSRSGGDAPLGERGDSESDAVEGGTIEPLEDATARSAQASGGRSGVGDAGVAGGSGKCDLRGFDASVKPRRCDGSAAERFWSDCDWGLVDKFRSRLETRLNSSGSSLRCASDRMRSDRYCEGRRILLDLGDDPNSTLFGPWGHWTPLLRAARPWDGAPEGCDVRFSRRTVLLKPDSHSNYYHMLCDHINIFASMHIPSDWTDPPFQPSDALPPQGGGSPSYSHPRDLLLLMAPSRKSPGGTFASRFLPLYEPYTSRSVLSLAEHWSDGSTLCFADVVLALNSRGGSQNLFFNMHVPGDCRRSGLFRAWSDFVTGKPGLSSRGDLPAGSLRGAPVRASVLTRNGGGGTTSGTRHLVNQDELVRAARERLGPGGVDIRILDFDFSRNVGIDEQVQAVLDTDVLVSMHGAGLAHLSFLPAWGVAFEIYNCGDKGCYHDLARLKGVKYMTLPGDNVTRVKPLVDVKEERLSNPKFWNYNIAVEPFVAKILEAVDYLKRNPDSPYYECDTE